MKLVRYIFPVAILLFAAALHAAELKGTVKSVSGDSASVAMEGNVMPPNGTKAEFFFKLGNDEVSVASGTALNVNQGELRVRIEDATGAVEPGHLVRFPGTSGGTPNDSSAASLTLPSTPAPAPALDDPNADPFLTIVAQDSPAYPYLSRASAQYNAKDITAAIAALTEGIRTAPSIGELYLMRGSLYLMKQKWKAAIADANKALDLKTAKPHGAYLIRGTAKGDQGNYKAGIADLDKAIEQKPDYSSAYNNRANYKIGLGNFRGALADSNKALEIRPDTAEAYVNRGYAYGYLGDYSMAVNDLRRAFELNSAFAKDKQIKAKLAELERKAGKTRTNKNPPIDDDL